MLVPINLSNRHIHLTDKDVHILFGDTATLTKKAELLQPGQFAAEQTVSIKGPHGVIESVRVVGPTRTHTQCEILTGDTYKLGYAQADVPVRISGNIADSAAFEIIGPVGSIHTSDGLIIAQRHIHIDPKTATDEGLSDGQVVSLQLDTPGKRIDLHDVVIRITTDALLECHIDVEEGNAAGIGNGYQATVII